MNILILTHSYPDERYKWRGIFIREQALALSAEHKVYIVYFNVDYQTFEPFSKYSFSVTHEGDVRLFNVIVKRSLPVITQYKYLVQTMKFLRREIIEEYNISLIHSHLSYPAGFLGALIQRKTGIPNILTEHSTLRMYFRSFIHRFCVKYALRHSNAVIAVSRSLSREITAVADRKVNVVPNIVNTKLFNPDSTKTGSELIVGFLGTLNSQNKGLDLLIKAVSQLDKLNLKLQIGGTGTLLPLYRSMAAEYGIEERCSFMGEITRGNIAGFYSGLDIFVLPSRYETFGLVLIEALASGVPVISTRCGGPEDIVTEETGILVSKDDSAELAKAIEYMAGRLGSYNRVFLKNYVKKNFSSEVIAAKISEIYKNALSTDTNE